MSKLKYKSFFFLFILNRTSIKYFSIYLLITMCRIIPVKFLFLYESLCLVLTIIINELKVKYYTRRVNQNLSNSSNVFPKLNFVII